MQRLIGEQVEQPVVLLGNLGGELRRRLVADDLLDGRVAGVAGVPGGYPRLAADGATALALAVLVGELIEGLAGGDDDEQPPEVVAVVELGEAAAGDALEKAVEGVLNDVLLVMVPITKPHDGARRMSASADRNLLFGILALQNGLITREHLVAAIHAWTADKSRPMGELLVAAGAMTPAGVALLEPLVAHHVEQHGGDAQQSLAALASVSSVQVELMAVADPDL